MTYFFHHQTPKAVCYEDQQTLGICSSYLFQATQEILTMVRYSSFIGGSPERPREVRVVSISNNAHIGKVVLEDILGPVYFDGFFRFLLEDRAQTTTT